MSNETAQKSAFDPHQYAIDGGWSATEIRLTAERGVADEDEARILDYYGDDDEGAADAISALGAWAIAWVATVGEDTD